MSAQSHTEHEVENVTVIPKYLSFYIFKMSQLLIWWFNVNVPVSVWETLNLYLVFPIFTNPLSQCWMTEDAICCCFLRWLHCCHVLFKMQRPFWAADKPF